MTPEYKAVIDKAFEIYDRKGKDYCIGRAEVDRLANFRASADKLGITMMQAWAVHFDKHLSAVFAYAKTGKVESEGIEGRLLDIINYAVLGLLITKQNPKQLELPFEQFALVEAKKAVEEFKTQKTPFSWGDRHDCKAWECHCDTKRSL